MRQYLRRAVVAVAQFVRAACLIACLTVALFALLEAGVRLKKHYAPRFQDRPAVPLARDPRLQQPWFRQYFAENVESRFTHWQPFVYFRRNAPYHGKFVNVDSLGHRVTTQPTSPAVPSARVFFYGGSTMWGTSQRDDHTIASNASARLQPLAGAGNRVEVVNFGDAGHVFTQGVLQLMLELREHNYPDVVVFYDGINDAWATVQNGVAGVTQNENKRRNEFVMGRALDRTDSDELLHNDLRAFKHLLLASLPHLELYNSIVALKPAPTPAIISADSAARATVRMYVENVRLVEALAREYGFTPIYVWQPSFQSSKKVFTPFEQRILKTFESDSFQLRLIDTHKRIPAIMDSAMKDVVKGRFVDAAGLFAGDTSHIFVDRIGHTMEEAVPPIVDTFWPALEAATRAQLAKNKVRAARH